MRITELGAEQPVEQKDVNLQGSFMLHNITAPQSQRRVQLTDDFADLRDDGELVISLGDVTYQEFDLKDKSCSNAVELYKPAGLDSDIVLLITCKEGKVLYAKYSNDEYSIDSVFVSEHTSSTPVIVTNNGISTAIYTVVAEGISALAIRSLEPNGYEQFMYEDTFEDTFGSCTETLSYNETHVRLLCSNTHDFYLVDGTGETDGRKIHPQGMGDLVNIYNKDIILVVSSSFVTINTKESTNFCTLDLPTSVTRVDYAPVNGKLLLLFFSSKGIYQYDTSTSCVNENLVILVNETLLGLNGDYQNYLIFSDVLVYTVLKNELHSSQGINLTTSENLGVLANHQNHPLLYGFSFDDVVITDITPTITSSSEPTSTTSVSNTLSSSTSTVASVSNTTSSTSTVASVSNTTSSTSTVTSVSKTTSSSTGMVTTTTSSSITTFSNTSSTNKVTSNIRTLTFVTMTSTPSTTGQSKLLNDVIPYVVGTCISIVVFILFFISLIMCFYCRKKYRHCCRKQLPLVIPRQEKSFPLEHIQRTSFISSESNTPPVETTSLGSDVQPSVPVGSSPLQNTNRPLHSSSCLSINRIPFGTQEEVDTYMNSIHNNKNNNIH